MLHQLSSENHKMDTKKKHANYINYKLMKILGLYQLLNPRESYMVLGYNLYQFLYAFPLLMELITIGFGMFGLYYWINDISVCIQILLVMSPCFSTIFLAIRFVQKYHNFKECFEVMKEDFLSDDNYSKAIYEFYKKKCIKITNIYALAWFFVWLAWIISPIFIEEYPAKNLEGELLIYRNNVLNVLYSPIPVIQYNNLYEIFYTLEVISVSHIIIGYVVYETLLITFCWMISAQLETIASKYSAFGHDSSLTTDILDNELNVTDKFVKIISDHQRVIRVMNTFYDIAKPLSIIQIGINANIFIICTYMLVLNYFDGLSMLSIGSIKWMSSVMIMTSHLFIFCYFFGYLDDQKKSVNFALYSSDWTQADIGFKKLVLLAMNMNNAIDNTSIKLTPTKIVNLELFTSVMHASYSIVSVLAKKKLSESR